MGTVLQAFSKIYPIYLLIHLKNLIIHSFRQQHLCDLKVVKRINFIIKALAGKITKVVAHVLARV